MNGTGSALLGGDDPPPFDVVRPDSESPFVIVVDHAGRAIPKALAGLGLPPEALDLHIAYDIGALGVARKLGAALDACAISQPYSRLVIDCNRAPDQTGSILAVSDGVAIPGNADLSPTQRAARVEAIHSPYHRRIGEVLERRRARGSSTVMVFQHSFTPRMAGIERPWRVGVLHLGDSSVSEAMLTLLRAESDLVVGDNEPYAMDGTDYTAPRHARYPGDDMLELEVRQDLIADDVGQAAMAARFARLLPQALQQARQRSRTALP
ncbi:MAG: N-formylglutamate amidohydrolase [Caulobacteraceae bacterium]